MRKGSRFHRAASWLAILALPLAYANVGLALIAINFDLTAFSDAVHAFQLVASHPHGAELIRWAMLMDMLGFYLLLVPLALVLWKRQKDDSPQLANPVALAGLGYLFFGALGAAILVVVLPEQIYAYTQATTADPQVHEAIFLAFKGAIHDGVWDTLNPLLAGVWWIGNGFLLAQVPHAGLGHHRAGCVRVAQRDKERSNSPDRAGSVFCPAPHLGRVGGHGLATQPGLRGGRR